MTKPLRIAVVGAGAFGVQHLDAIASLGDAEVVSLVGRNLQQTREIAGRHGIAQAGIELDEVLARSDIDAVILCTPTPLHAAQAIACLRAGKHVQVEIPLAESIDDAEAVRSWQQRTGLIAMCGHTRRFNSGHQWLHERIVVGEFSLRQLDVQTHFLRRINTNALGQPRSWTDHLLWHHAAHTIDLFQYQTGEEVIAANVLQGPLHPKLGIALDMSIQLKSRGGALCTLSLSFNNDGPLGSTFRYIGDGPTYIARYDALTNGMGEAVELDLPEGSLSGVARQDREFVAAIRERREPNASVASVLPCYRVLQQLAQQLG
ncbi:Gfo/Idh/MocA family oxidoreductase [Pandoraea terrigena]|uniref:4-carboxy-2-hydroxymuconate-6-semialdehyde dehydrogenase n=1 Tax=Pandoraea terrigena TaxID=2508292 RepID=A0A5E4UCM3_9BURK|nr:Gfo/Idh/MocA family oxidoreductase [Pandoraea terrigena]VVD97292.1 4-carboxy-2-hydroxymuconate-6-semialdehyde dehydrogenase [Pandoraea terrigena]